MSLEIIIDVENFIGEVRYRFNIEESDGALKGGKPNLKLKYSLYYELP